jgi:hypothetical protein
MISRELWCPLHRIWTHVIDFWLWGNLKAKDNLKVIRMLCFNFNVQWQSCMLGVMHACELKEVTSRALFKYGE